MAYYLPKRTAENRIRMLQRGSRITSMDNWEEGVSRAANTSLENWYCADFRIIPAYRAVANE